MNSHISFLCPVQYSQVKTIKTVNKFLYQYLNILIKINVFLFPSMKNLILLSSIMSYQQSLSDISIFSQILSYYACYFSSTILQIFASFVILAFRFVSSQFQFCGLIISRISLSLLSDLYWLLFAISI